MTMRTNIFRMELTPMRASVSWEGYAFNRYFSDGCGEPRLGAPRIHGELIMLGFKVSERAISCWMRRALRDSRPAKRWLTLLHDHREAIAAMDFFTVPTLTIKVYLTCECRVGRSEEHTSELQSLTNLVCRLLLEKKKKINRSELNSIIKGIK